MIVVGLVAEMFAWWRVSRGGNVWTHVTPVLASMGVAALLVGPPAWSPDASSGVALVAGLAMGIVLYGATRVAMLVFSRRALFERHSVQMYERQGGLSLGVALVLSLALSVPGEELFWRGLVQEELASALDGRMALAAVVAWVAFVAANLPGGNLAIAAGAVVGGAVWGALAWWTGGVLAPLACHIVWTGLMIALPVVRVRPPSVR
ncbi:MAG: CPBP family glutamic-type intramembrane protease [Actinobacteria bacterium]|nr:CPBP family glutamic-type intramembrane protease [Actinomycetota bacterium]